MMSLFDNVSFGGKGKKKSKKNGKSSNSIKSPTSGAATADPMRPAKDWNSATQSGNRRSTGGQTHREDIMNDLPH